MTGFESWAVFLSVFCLGYIIGSYQRNRTKLSYYKLGVVEATEAIQQQLVSQQQQMVVQQPQDSDDNSNTMGFNLTPSQKDEE